MKVFVVGSQGQLGQTLVETVPDAIDFAGADLPELDIVNRGALEARFAAEQPGFVVNAAAYTAVDKAESEPDVARRINVDGARNVAQAAREAGARVIHISTDFVFDGSKTEPYTPADTPAPLGVYGQTKLDGDTAVRQHRGRRYRHPHRVALQPIRAELCQDHAAADERTRRALHSRRPARHADLGGIAGRGDLGSH